ncbi:MAG: mechanosensitive ion channel family protein [Holosporaceae bacterium]|nr:mechanosensitive ion channel family protein [Holosporaceae bacterium]
MTLVIIVSLFLSRKFINIEFDKLKDVIDCKFDQFIILASGIVLSALIVVIGVSALGLMMRLFIQDADKVCDSYLRLMLIFSSLMITSYTVAAPNHVSLGLIILTPEESKKLYKTLMGVLSLSFAITVAIYPFIAIISNKKNILLWEHVLMGVMIVFYFFQMVMSDHLLKSVFDIKKTNMQNMSSKITGFINEKFTYLALVGMIAVVMINNNNLASSTKFFVNVNDIFSLLFEMFAFQILIVCIINKFFTKLEELNDIGQSKMTFKRMENLVWICDIVVLVLYFVVLCFMMKFAGIDVGKYVFHDKVVILAWIIFITTIFYKGFHEFEEALLEKSKNEDLAYYTKLQTFLPTISVAFHALLFLVALLIGLANFDINVTPILAAFSVFSAAIGLAAKDVIQAFLQGVTLLMERNLYVGEKVKINDVVGIIEKLSVRVIHLRLDDGSVHSIPYNHVDAITNYSSDQIRHYDDLRVLHAEDVSKAFEILRDVIADMRQSPEYAGKIVDDVKIYGIKPFDLSGIRISWMVITTPEINDSVLKCDLYSRLMVEFTKQNLEIPMWLPS